MGEFPLGELVNSESEVPVVWEDGVISPLPPLSLAEVVAAEGDILTSKFVKHFCDKEVLHLPSENRTRFRHLLSWDAINSILSQNLLDRNRLRITRDGRDIPPALYRIEKRERDYISAPKLRELLKQNASIVMNGVQDLSRPVRRIALQIEKLLNQKVNVNGYMTFGPGGAFAMHYDTHDVLVLQVDGTKHWFIYDDPEDSPMLEEKKQPLKARPRNVVFEAILQPGDALYVPRGTYHRAAVTDTDSVHLTFGIHTAKGVDFVDWLRSEVIQNEPLFRRDLLAMGAPAAVAQQERVLKARLCELVNEASLGDYLEKFQKARKPLDRFHLGPSEELHDSTMLAPLVRYPTAWQENLKSTGREVPAAGERIMALLVEKDWATVRDVKAELGTVFDQDIIESTLAELISECWVEVIR